jgi:uncharacterized protein (DUF885 family)
MKQQILVSLATVATVAAATVAVAALWSPGAASAAPAQANIAATSPEAIKARLDRIYDDAWQRWLREDPTLATSAGDPRYNDRWPDLSPAAIQKSDDADKAVLAALGQIDSATLAEPDRLNYDIVKFQFERRLALARFKPRLWWISQLGSVQNANSLQTASEIAEISPFATVGDYENWIARLRGFGTYLDQGTELLKMAVREKRTQPRVIMLRVKPQIEAQRVATPESSPFFQPFTHMPDSISSAERKRLIGEGKAAISAAVLPAFARFDRFFSQTYLPACRDSVAISDTPDGQDYYRALIAYHTTTQLTADDIHRIGLAEVERIRAEMDKIIAALGYRGSFQEFTRYLRTDPKFFYTDPTDLLHGYMVIAKSIDPNLVTLFGKLPRTPYGVRAIPDISAPNSTTAYYQPLAADGSRPGYYYVNLYKPEARPKWEMAVLTSHEAVPGHHLQIALQYENAAGVPLIRRMADFTAYAEGWGLYAESLGDQLGLYSDPYSKFGQLTYDMWRAVRLVVDTGMHVKGWTRPQAIEYFMANAPKSELDITNEIDRYIAWPGQALAYKVGQMKILELRATARQALGPKFDIREFHDVVLSTGAVPLAVLEREVQRWLAAKATASSRRGLAGYPPDLFAGHPSLLSSATMTSR